MSDDGEQGPRKPKGGMPKGTIIGMPLGAVPLKRPGAEAGAPPASAGAAPKRRGTAAFASTMIGGVPANPGAPAGEANPLAKADAALASALEEALGDGPPAGAPPRQRLPNLSAPALQGPPSTELGLPSLPMPEEVAALAKQPPKPTAQALRAARGGAPQAPAAARQPDEGETEASMDEAEDSDAPAARPAAAQGKRAGKRLSAKTAMRGVFVGMALASGMVVMVGAAFYVGRLDGAKVAERQGIGGAPRVGAKAAPKPAARPPAPSAKVAPATTTPAPAATTPATEQPVAAQPVAAQPVAAQPVAAQPAAAQPVAAQPVAAQPAAADPPAPTTTAVLPAVTDAVKALDEEAREKAAKSLRNKAARELRAGNAETAAALVLEALQHDPGSSSAARDYAEVLMAQKRPAEAYPWAVRATTLAPRASDAWLTLGDAEAAVERRAAARAAWQRAVTLNADNAAAKSRLNP